MSDVAVRVEGLSKLYHIGGKQEAYRTLRDTLTDALASPFRRAGSLLRGQSHGASNLNETIWALKDVSFEVKKGEVVGIIGRNGAGKSTLLKILSRITDPSKGYVEVFGRVGSLLEVGTGFHPELTGRENIYLNGAILGMSRREIDHKFDEIVDFAEVEKFIDTPVKHYSSGMGLRLGFAVAAHLEPEILIVDEVLAVGDAAFQKKCLGKMGEVAGEGRTVLFVSHNMVTVSNLCERGVLLSEGSLLFDDKIDNVITRHMRLGSQNAATYDLAHRSDRKGTGQLRFTSVSLYSKGMQSTELMSGDPVEIRVSYTSQADELRNISVAIRFEDSLGRYLFTASTYFTDDDFQLLPPQGTVICKIPTIPLLQGRYSLYLSASISGIIADSISQTFEFDVTPADVYGTGRFPVTAKHGAIFVPHAWAFQK